MDIGPAVDMVKSTSTKVIPVVSHGEEWLATKVSMSRKKRSKKSFKLLITEVIYQLSVVHQLKVRTRKSLKKREESKRNVKAESKPERVDMECDTAPAAAEKQSSLTSSTTVEAEKKVSLKGHLGQNMPMWWKSLSRKSSKDLSRKASRDLASRDLSRTSSTMSDTGSIYSIGRSLKFPSCSCSEATGGMCKRHALRKLWNKYFFAFPRVNAHDKPEDVDMKASASMDREVLSALLKEDTVLVQPEQCADGKSEVMDVFLRYEDMATDSPVKVEIIHLYVDEESSATFSEYVLEFGPKRRHMRICEAMYWDLDAYKVAGNNFNKEFILSNPKPAIKRIEYYGKAMKINVQSCTTPVKLQNEYDIASKCRGSFRNLVEKYLRVFTSTDTDEMEKMLCLNFRMSSFDGIKQKEDFLMWVQTLNGERGCSKSVETLLVDSKSKTLFMKLKVQCNHNVASVVHVIQWNVDAERIICVREYGESYRMF